VLRLAEDAARHHGHHHLGVEHLMLGILDGGPSMATGVLQKFVDLATVREEIGVAGSQRPRAAVPGAAGVARTGCRRHSR
jgi:ATP-dependent Clp protease ATP-binding subunit ClpA